MSNTSNNKTSKETTPAKGSKAKKSSVRVIIDEISRDTQTGILGRGYSYDNGKTFHVLDTIYGRLYTQLDGSAIWSLLHPRVSDYVDKEVKSAQAGISSAVAIADSAASTANSAVAASKVNSDAINAMSSAINAAKSGADQAIKDATSAIASVETVRPTPLSLMWPMLKAKLALLSQRMPPV